jgi:peptidoglycan hydrolase-like protein with peptidoglycan-binding domain
MIATFRHPARTVVVALATVALLGAAGCGDDSDDPDSTTTTSATPTSGAATSSAIRQLQSELDTLGCDAGPTDGELGPDTDAAIRRFQAAAGLTVDGIVGVNTRNALGEASRRGAPDCRNTPPPPSSTTATTAGGSAPCTQQAITDGVLASAPGVTVGQYECSGNWAEAQATTPGPNGYEYTVLLRGNGSTWASVDRGTYCENGDVPQAIFQAACETN